MSGCMKSSAKCGRYRDHDGPCEFIIDGSTYYVHAPDVESIQRDEDSKVGRLVRELLVPDTAIEIVTDGAQIRLNVSRPYRPVIGVLERDLLAALRSAAEAGR